ncbi:MAG: 4-(cytidine 5'-diphospho)-2-C-methyl-D-erythritol kinase [Ruminococcaceae bacterium]|nr:4-(cytidine 5'-diphospho)-2-C-methyl-D-erythritol kinase [Oscillospiraceae bacterium]
MITLQEPAYAKVNLTLDVLYKREDGYHEIETVMQSVSLCDDIEIDLDTHKPWCIQCDAEGIPLDSKNLVWKAARLFFDTIEEEPDGIKIRITKRIPSEAGLAGGSADAAAVLRALNRWKGSPFSKEALADLSAKIGSDIPFCVRKETALACGRGERLKGLKTSARIYYVICKPELSFSTPKLYAKLDQVPIQKHPETQAMCEVLCKGSAQEIGTLLCNVFEEALGEERSQIESIKKMLLQNGACGAQMTGSGSAVFGIFTSQEAAEAAAQAMKTQPLKVFTAMNV